MKKASILIFVLALMLLTSVSVGNASDYVYVTLLIVFPGRLAVCAYER